MWLEFRRVFFRSKGERAVGSPLNVTVIVTEDLRDYGKFPFLTAIGIEQAARETGDNHS